MKTFLILLIMVVCNFTSASTANYESGLLCNSEKGGDAWPWSFAQPFPWDNIEGYWQLGDDQSSFLSAHVLSSTKNRKILSLSVLGDGICSKPYAKGTGYIDITDKNVVRALVVDGIYKYQLKLGMFDSRDVIGMNSCADNVMGVSIQVIGQAKKSNYGSIVPIDPNISQTRNVVLKKVTLDVNNACKIIN